MIKNTEADFKIGEVANVAISHANMESSVRAVIISNNSRAVLTNLTFKRTDNGAGDSSGTPPILANGSSYTRVISCSMSGADAGVRLYESSGSGAQVVCDAASLSASPALNSGGSLINYGGEEYVPYGWPSKLDNSIPAVSAEARGMLLRKIGRDGVATDDLFLAYADVDNNMTWESVVNRKAIESLRSIIKVNGTSQTVTLNTIYEQNNAALITFTLVTGSPGEWVEVHGSNVGGWRVTAPAGQKIRYGGSFWNHIDSSQQFSCVKIVRQQATNQWVVTSIAGQ